MRSCFEDYGLNSKTTVYACYQRVCSVLSLFSSYLTDRSQCIFVTEVLFEKLALPWLVPQGSYLGRLLFIIKVSKRFEILDAHLPNVHVYADD